MFNLTNVPSVSQFLSEHARQITSQAADEFKDWDGPLFPARYLADQRAQVAADSADVTNMLKDEEPTIAWFLIEKEILWALHPEYQKKVGRGNDGKPGART